MRIHGPCLLPIYQWRSSCFVFILTLFWIQFWHIGRLLCFSQVCLFLLLCLLHTCFVWCKWGKFLTLFKVLLHPQNPRKWRLPSLYFSELKVKTFWKWPKSAHVNVSLLFVYLFVYILSFILLQGTEEESCKNLTCGILANGRSPIRRKSGRFLGSWNLRSPALAPHWTVEHYETQRSKVTWHRSYN